MVTIVSLSYRSLYELKMGWMKAPFNEWWDGLDTSLIYSLCLSKFCCQFFFVKFMKKMK